MGYQIARWIIRLTFRLIARVEVRGAEKLPKSGAFIVASNHVGRLDAPLVYYLLENRKILLLVAEKYRKSAIIRWFVKRLDLVWVDRFHGDLGAMRASLDRLRKGNVLVLAPEGTRSPTGALNHARFGTSYLAAKAGVPVYPVALTGTEDAKVKARLRRLRRLEIAVQVGEPLIFPPVKGQDREAVLQAYTDEIMCRIAASLPPSSRGVYANHPRLRELLS